MRHLPPAALCCTAIALAWILLASAPSIAQAPRVSGVVYVDEDEDGERDHAERGLAGVGVSNGRDVTFTDAQGAYAIPADWGEFIFVIKPAGYRWRTAADGRTLFYLPVRASDLAPGALGGRHDFPLLPGPADESFSVLVLADPQVNDAYTAGLLERGIVAPLAGNRRFRFGLTLGDIVWDDLNLLPQVTAILARVGIPWLHTIGNHDVDMRAASPLSAETAFRQMYGPSHYAFNEGRVHFLVLNSVLLEPKDGRLHYSGGLTPRQLEFIERDLANVPKDRLVVVAMHHPLYRATRPGTVLAEPHRARLFALLAPFRTLSLSGHAHAQVRLQFGAQEGWLGTQPHEHFTVGTASGDWWAGRRNAEGLPDAMMRDGTPQGYASVTFDGAEYRLEYTPAGASATGQFHVDGPSIVNISGVPSYVYVNYYLGRVDTDVSFRASDGDWQPLTRVWEEDPVRRRKYHAWANDAAPPPVKGTRPSPPVPSTHLWKAALPRDGEPGPRTIEIRIRTAEGEQLEAKHAYRLMP